METGSVTAPHRNQQYDELFERVKGWSDAEWQKNLSEAAGFFPIYVNCRYPGCLETRGIKCQCSTQFQHAEGLVQFERWFCAEHRRHYWETCEEIPDDLLARLHMVSLHGGFIKSQVYVEEKDLFYLHSIGLIKVKALSKRSGKCRVSITETGRRYLKLHAGRINSYLEHFPGLAGLPFWAVTNYPW